MICRQDVSSRYSFMIYDCDISMLRDDGSPDVHLHLRGSKPPRRSSRASWPGGSTPPRTCCSSDIQGSPTVGKIPRRAPLRHNPQTSSEKVLTGGRLEGPKMKLDTRSCQIFVNDGLLPSDMFVAFICCWFPLVSRQEKVFQAQLGRNA